MKDFRSLDSALQSGDLSSAQNAFATWQQSLPSSVAPNSSLTTQQTGPFGQNSKANSDYQALGSALQSGDVAGAQKAFASLKQDLHGTGQAHHAHHHHPAKNDGDADDAIQSANSTSSRPGTTGPSDLLNTQA
jgi:hypothetical protein